MLRRAPGQAVGAFALADRLPRRIWRAVRWLPAAGGVLVAVALGAWIVGRGHMLVMQTPSMGTTAPAGSLVLTRPLGNVPLRRGMIVAFHVPNTGQVYMHRVAALLAGGRFRTRGDLNAADDGWELTRAAVVGLPVLIVPDLGWVVLSAPYALAVLALGMLLGQLLPRAVRPALRSATVGGAVALPLYVVRPFVRVAVASAGRITATASTGRNRPVPRVLDGGASVSQAAARAATAAHGRGPSWPAWSMAACFRCVSRCAPHIR